MPRELLKSGKPADAVPLLGEAARLEPHNARLQHDLGLACLESGRPEEAAASLRRAALLDPRYTDAHFRLGIALEKSGDPAGAIAAYDCATELLPSHTEAWFRAGALVFTMGHREEAAGCFRRAAATGPKTSFGRLGAARALLTEERDAEAERALRRLLALDQGNAMAHDLLGNLLAEQGRFDEARQSFARAIAQAPLMAGSYYDLVRCRRVTTEDGDLSARMRAALATPGLDAAQRLRIHLAMGKVADDSGDYAQAMEQFDAADAVAARRTAIRCVCVRPGNRPDDRPFHAGAGGPGRDPRQARSRAGADPGHAPFRHHAGRADRLQPPRGGGRRRAQLLERARRRLDTGRVARNRQRSATDGSRLSRRSARDRTGRRRGVTDKMPFNFLWAGLIHLACPGATIVHCRRAAIDVALSIHQTHFNASLTLPTRR